MAGWILLGVTGLLLAAGLGLWSVRRRFQARAVRLWLEVQRPAPGAPLEFAPELCAEVPEPARRYLLRALPAGRPLADRVELEAEGEIKLGARFEPFVSREILARRRGFVWKADLARPVSAVDHYLDDQGEMRVLALWALPVVRAGGPDVTRSSRHRFAAEHPWLPQALLPQAGVVWRRLDERRAVAGLLIDAEPIDLTLTIGPDGRLEALELQRWSERVDPERPEAGKTWRLRTYVARVESEGTFDGVTIPTGLSVGYRPQPQDPALEVGFRVTVTQACFRCSASPGQPLCD